ncbi:2-polyprenyl-6-methoxyphenol hydroxylase-like FAD-dependent oxidoreductase [Kribbella orskensis]|uniref:2-polyprenyl-6-methoxyphenol hydroxylase-like FAD-dependent oxidoreductase n=1 Tax=Kribbella orskensis TaxID=2512216 RepID=A0ABY2BEB3_9ACTN|nr:MULTISPECIES: FAD-dependent monooxygenase [Kribbella]TCN36608.1 2-polyprenyl-6-methoxyphenol hydroxylase-like FAD-dependent oxidoreductase [Kribbella sp. VKM Ac-2500]TCO17847.1 2-polyprenyl-6-methoxyphenol hydroxylase-like FAD-dependent oxidoreductase [Kribbella orskensis]
MKILISGASVAGPAIAYWLGRYGHDVTVVELAPALRQGGYAVDFRGDVNKVVLERMGVLDDLRARQTGGSAMRFVDEEGKQVLRLPPEFAGGDLEVLRSDLSQVLYDHSKHDAEYIFGDSIATLDQHEGGVDVTFESGTARRFDLVVGADGLHSVVRRLAFGPERDYVSHLGYYIAGWELPNSFGIERESLMYNVPGRLASVGVDHRDPGKAGAMFIFASPELTYDRRDVAQQHAILREAYSGLGWHVPQILDGLADSTELYFDSISRVDAEGWSSGWVVLLGDAGYGATVGGMGTGTAIVAAYVLAGELARSGGNHAAAFAAYEQQLRKPVQACQSGGNRTGKFLAPGTRFGLVARNHLLGNAFLLNQMLRMGQKRSSGLPIRDYAVSTPA